MRPSIRKPGGDAIRSFLTAQEGEPVAYDEVGATRGDAAPGGYDYDRSRVRLGEGETVYGRAAGALRSWAPLRLGWIEAHPTYETVREGAAVVLLMRAAGLWWPCASRVVYVEEEAGASRRYAFAYGTLPGHVERGEERFSVEWHADGDDSVWYEIRAFSRPVHLLARIGYPYVRLLQRRFVKHSIRTLVDAAKG